MRLLILTLLASQCFGAFLYSRSVTVGGAVVSSGPHTDFRMLVSGTYSYLATEANGGKVKNASGYDIGFYSNANCSTGKLAWKTISYNATTGAVIYKVKVSSLDNNSVIYLCYGDASISTDQSNSAGVYASSVGGAWGLDDNAANTTVADGTGNTATGTSAANTSTKTVTAKIGSGLTFNGSSDYVTVPNNSTLNASTGLTISLWVKRLVTGTNNWLVYKETTDGNHLVYGVEFNAADKVNISLADSGTGIKFCSGSTAVTSTTVYQHVVVSYNATGSTSAIYLNGSSDGSGTPGTGGCGGGTTYSGNLTSSTGQLNLGRARYESAYYYGNAELDDVEVENVVRTAGWISTEYRSESSPGTFYTVGSETSPATTVILRRAILQ